VKNEAVFCSFPLPCADWSVQNLLDEDAKVEFGACPKKFPTRLLAGETAYVLATIPQHSQKGEENNKGSAEMGKPHATGENQREQ
jgi:hypothetical protein